MRMLNPPHPGDFIRTEVIAPNGLSVKAAAEILGVSRPTLSNLLNGNADLSTRWLCASKKPLASGWTRSCGCSRPMTLLALASANAPSRSAAISTWQARRHANLMFQPRQHQQWHDLSIRSGLLSKNLRLDPVPEHKSVGLRKLPHMVD